jgi:hypothetical protein
MKKISLIFCLFLVFLSVEPVFAVDEDFHFGFQILQESISKADDIRGGSYLYLGSAFSLGSKFTINAKYAWNISPDCYTDHLVSLEPQYTFGNPGELMNSNLSLVYLENLNQNHSRYYGIRFCPVSSGRSFFTPNVKMSMEFLPIGVLYNAHTGQYVTTFEFFSVTTYF